MFGWIETGGFFEETRSEDIVFRTTYSNQILAIGNATKSNDCRAALYIQDNHIGVKCIPDPEVAIKIGGNACITNGVLDVIDQSTLNRVRLDGSIMRLVTSDNTSTIQLNCIDSSIKGESVTTKNILTPKRILSGVHVMSVEATTYQESIDDPLQDAYLITIDGLYDAVFSEMTTFIIRDRTFLVLKADLVGNNLRLLITKYSRYYAGALVFSSGETVDIEVLEEWTPVNVGARKETLYYKFSVDQYGFEALVPNPDTTNGVVPNGILDIRVYYYNRKHVLRETLQPGSLHILCRSKVMQTNVPPLVLLKLLSIDTYSASNGQIGYHMRFKSIDGRMDLLGLESHLQGQVLMFPLTNLRPKVESDDDAIVGYTIDAISNKICYQVVSAALASNIHGSGALKSYGVDQIILGNRGKQFVNTAYKIAGDAPDTVVIDTFKVNDPIYNVSRQSIKYYFHGIPMRVASVTRRSESVFDMVLNTDNAHLLTDCRAYEGQYVCWFDNQSSSYIFGLNQLRENLDKTFSCSVTVLSHPVDEETFYVTERIVYVLPFKYTNHVRISNAYENAYVPYKLSIGKYSCEDALEVDGDVSFQGRVALFNNLDDRELVNRFDIRYDDECVLSMGGRMRLTESNAIFASDIETHANVTASSYLQYSDARLKTNISVTDPAYDLQRIIGIDIKTFNFCGNQQKTKGVIAQDICTAFPEAVDTIKGVLPGFVGVVAYVDKGMNSLRVHGMPDISASEGAVIRISPLKKDTHQDVRVKCKTQVLMGDELVVYLEIYEDLKSCDCFVRILGVVENIMRVNSDVLYMTAINAIKELKREVDELKKLVFG